MSLWPHHQAKKELLGALCSLALQADLSCFKDLKLSPGPLGLLRMAKLRYQSPGLASVVLGPESWGMGLALSVPLPPDLQGQQPVVVGDSVLAGWKETGIDPDVVLVPVETQ